MNLWIYVNLFYNFQFVQIARQLFVDFITNYNELLDTFVVK